MTVTWNDTAITGPVLIYQDEIIQDNRDVLTIPLDGTVRCISENQAIVGWHFTNGNLVSPSIFSINFRQSRTGSGETPSVSRLSTNQPDVSLTADSANGLWTCRLNGGISDAVPVGIFARGGGKKRLNMQVIHHWVIKLTNRRLR